MNTNMTGFRWFSKKSLRPCVLDECSLRIGRVNLKSHPIQGDFTFSSYEQRNKFMLEYC